MIGRLLAWLPVKVVAAAAIVIGWLIYRLPIKRNRTLRSNLHHAYPEKGADWRARVGRRATRRLVEMALFSLASPYLSKERLAGCFEGDEESLSRLQQAAAGETGGVVLLPHLTLFELMTAFPVIIPAAAGHAVVFRPLRQAGFDRWVKQTRERWGIELLSRRGGISQMSERLRAGKLLCLLFDQNAGRRGHLFYFFHRLASGTPLPGILSQKLDVPTYLLLPRRTGFWKAHIYFERLPQAKDAEEVILTSHLALENYLNSGEEQAADWLWFHERWGTQDHAKRRFALREKKNHLEVSRRFFKLDTPPKRTRIWVRLPNWLGDVVMAIPLLRALQAGRPDVELTVIAQPAMRALLERIDLADRILEIPDKKRSLFTYFRFFAQQRHAYPDTYLCLTNSARSDIEAFLTRAPQRMGMIRPGKRRLLLTDGWHLPNDVDETARHQMDVWEEMFRAYGLREAVDRTPLPRSSIRETVGLICGTENTPEKRWPVNRWRELTERLLEETSLNVHLYGTPRDAPITAQVAAGFPQDRVIDWAGKTTLGAFMDQLGQDRVVVCNDTGGMHLANLLGVPVMAVFGPTNPVRTGPVFEGTVKIIQPPNCPATGGATIEGVTVSHVWEAWKEIVDA